MIDTADKTPEWHYILLSNEEQSMLSSQLEIETVEKETVSKCHQIYYHIS